MAKVDLDNFYHRLRLPVWMRPFFALPAVRAGDVSDAVAAQFEAVGGHAPRIEAVWKHENVARERA